MKPSKNVFVLYSICITCSLYYVTSLFYANIHRGFTPISIYITYFQGHVQIFGNIVFPCNDKKYGNEGIVDSFWILCLKWLVENLFIIEI